MHISAFPLRATVVYDDVPDRGVFYDDAILKLVKLNEKSYVRDKVLLRKELRCLNEKKVFFPIQRWEKRKVKKTTTTEKGKTKTEEVQVLVLISYNWGHFTIVQTERKDTRTTTKEKVGTKFDISAGFVASLKYEDGYGSTTEFDGGSWNTQAVTVGHDVLGISDDFERGTESYEKNTQYYDPTSVCTFKIRHLP
jgi:hypothetical protein